MEISLFSEGNYLASNSVNHVPSSICPILTSDETVTWAISCCMPFPVLNRSVDATSHRVRKRVSWQELVAHSFRSEP